MGLLGWSHRHTLALWARSFAAALAGGRSSPRDLRKRSAALMRIAFDGRLSNARGLRRVRVVGDELQADCEAGWPMADVLATVLQTSESAAHDVDGGAAFTAPSRSDESLTVHA